MDELYVQMEKSRVLGKVCERVGFPRVDLPEGILLQTLTATAPPIAAKYTEWLTAFDKWSMVANKLKIDGMSEKQNVEIEKQLKLEADGLRYILIGE